MGRRKPYIVSHRVSYVIFAVLLNLSFSDTESILRRKLRSFYPNSWYWTPPLIPAPPYSLQDLTHAGTGLPQITPEKAMASKDVHETRNIQSGYGWGWTENQGLNELYQAALLEEGPLIVYVGADGAHQYDSIQAAFSQTFPGINLTMVLDLSKFHDARIDNQLANGFLIPDIAHLQTAQDFDRWKAQGVLLKYKPLNWDRVYSDFKDPDGYWTAICIFAFSNSVNTNLLGTNYQNWPTEADDYLQPRFLDKLVSTWPTDDDAVLFWYHQVIQKYGWDWLWNFMRNRPRFVRGVQYPYDMVHNCTIPAVFSTYATMRENNGLVRFVLPRKDPFVCWGQRAAIFKTTKKPNSAKLYMSWFLSDYVQQELIAMWSVRTDIPPPPGFRYIWQYAGQCNPTAFPKWMRNRGEVERFRLQVGLYTGEVTGPDPATSSWLGVIPPYNDTI